MEMKKLFGAVVMAGVLAACSSTDNVGGEDDPAAVDMSTDASGAQAAGTGDDANLDGGNILDANLEISTVYYFEFDSHGLDEKTRADLDLVAKELLSHNATVRLHGHADERGTREYNLALSERRAEAVKGYLIAQGVPSERVEIIGFGEEKPAHAESHSEAWSKNRRVELDK